MPDSHPKTAHQILSRAEDMHGMAVEGLRDCAAIAALIERTLRWDDDPPVESLRVAAKLVGFAASEHLDAINAIAEDIGIDRKSL